MGEWGSPLENLVTKSFWRGKRVGITGHTGFKGSWLSCWLLDLQANVFGFALPPEWDPSLFNQLCLNRDIDHTVADVRDAKLLGQWLERVQPDILFHLAAQPLVRRSYREPLLTWQTNVLGTVILLEALSNLKHACTVVIVTTDKVYENRERFSGYRESDQLGGHDPYSSSKAAVELASSSWRSSFYGEGSLIRLATARAGNVIGGGDWAEDRILPDLVRSVSMDHPVQVRNPNAIRPWQHVLEPLFGYLLLAEQLYTNGGRDLQSAFNFGPEIVDYRTVQELVETALQYWPGSWQDASNANAPHEARILSLNIEKARDILSWLPRWHFDQSVQQTMEWYRSIYEGQSARKVTQQQIQLYSNT